MTDPQQSRAPRKKAPWIVLGVSLAVVVAAAAITAVIATSSSGGVSASGQWRISGHLPAKIANLSRDAQASTVLTVAEADAEAEPFGTASSVDEAVYNSDKPTGHRYVVTVWDGTFEPPNQAYDTLGSHYSVLGGWKQMDPGPHGGMLACSTATLGGQLMTTCFFETSTALGEINGYTNGRTAIDPETVALLATEVRAAIETQG